MLFWDWLPVSVTLPKLYTFLVVYMPFILHNSIQDSKSTYVAMKIIWWNESMRESFSNTQLDKNIRLRVTTTTSNNDKSKNCIESFLVNTSWNLILLLLPFYVYFLCSFYIQIFYSIHIAFVYQQGIMIMKCDIKFEWI